jgi:hypothetical protein
MPAGFFPLACALEEPSETRVAVRDEWAHLELFGESERVAIMTLGLLRRIAAG